MDFYTHRVRCKVLEEELDEFIAWADQHTNEFNWQHDEPPYYVCWAYMKTPKDQMYARLRWG